MKIVLICDQHFGIKNDSEIFLDYMEKFYKDIFFPFIDKHKINHVIDLGDCFDRRKFTNHRVLDRAKKMYFDELKSRNIYSDIIIGNHNCFYKHSNTPNNVDLLLSEYDNLNVHSEIFGINNFLYVPWINDENREETIERIVESESKFVFGHLELANFQQNKSESSLSAHGMDAGIFDGFQGVYSGHYHTKSSKGNIHYLGCPTELYWNDYDDPKGFHLFDDKTGELTHIRNPYTIYDKIYYDDEANNYKKFDASPYAEKFIKLYIKKRTNNKLYDKFLDKLREEKIHDLEIIDETNYIQQEKVHVVGDITDMKESLNSYIDVLSMQVDPNAVKAKLAELHERVISK